MSRHHAEIGQAAWEGIRQRVFAAQGRRCGKCGKAGALEVHHVKELKAHGGTNDLSNLQVLCRGLPHLHPPASARGRGAGLAGAFRGDSRMTDHRIICGDAVDGLPTLDVQADLILTSPPYDNLRTYGGHGFDFDRVADTCVGALAEGGVLVWVVADATVDGSETGTSFRHALGFMDRGLKLHDTMIYERAFNGPWVANRYDQVFEYMFVFSNGSPSTANIIADKPNAWAGDHRKHKGALGRTHDQIVHSPRDVTVGEFGRRMNIWRYGVGKYKSAPDFLDAHDHPAIFPLQLALDHITTWTNPGDLVIDPMAGSGTVSRAAKNLGRNSVAIEIHEPYVDIIRRCLSQEVMSLMVN